MLLAAFHERSLGILVGGASSTSTAAVTLTTADGGLPNDLSSVMLAWGEGGRESDIGRFEEGIAVTQNA